MFKASLIIAATLLAGSIANAGPFPMQQKLNIQDMKIKLPAGKPNLTILNMGLGGEFCGMNCSDVRQDLKIDKSSCPFLITVKNKGNANARSFTVQLKYTNWKGVAVTKTRNVNGLNRGQAKNITFSGASIGYYRYDRPFKVFVDSGNVVTESNENDNKRNITLN
jgi:hypothetical protein